ncbi:Uma2 family endonuclease [Thauera butanivorans]|uniref:Uma2 family endonuclease n=1 Tax=Thauera butanivorans TaxID=86174 RepID=UPI0008395A75|nr:Uma2 family endonuclease [Thauera butanivorans]
MPLPETKPEFGIEAYMAWEDEQPERHEYLAGETFAMSGGTDAHYTILGNVFAELRTALVGKSCRAFISGMKLRIDRADAVFYPDVFVTCDPRDRQPDASLAKQYPSLVVEVLSGSTAAFDRGRKFELYQQIETLREYLLIEQDRKHADLFRKNEDGLWVLHPAGPGGVIRLESVGVELALEGLYEDVELELA